MPGREPILSTFIRIDLGPVRQEKAKEPHAITYSETMSKETQELEAELMAKYTKMIYVGSMRSQRWG